MSEEPCDEDIEGTEDFEFFEVRLRDPAFLTELNAQDLRQSYRRAECCWDRERWLVEVPRVRKVGTKMIDMPPARFRLCSHHAKILISEDPEARISQIGSHS